MALQDGVDWARCSLLLFITDASIMHNLKDNKAFPTAENGWWRETKRHSAARNILNIPEGRYRLSKNVQNDEATKFSRRK